MKGAPTEADAFVARKGPVLEFRHGMDNVHITLGLAACLTAFATARFERQSGRGAGCWRRHLQHWVSKTMGGMSQSADLLKAAVDKAGEYCHSKGQKLQVTSAESKITFRCISEGDATKSRPE